MSAVDDARKLLESNEGLLARFFRYMHDRGVRIQVIETAPKRLVDDMPLMNTAKFDELFGILRDDIDVGIEQAEQKSLDSEGRLIGPYTAKAAIYAAPSLDALVRHCTRLHEERGIIPKCFIPSDEVVSAALLLFNVEHGMTEEEMEMEVNDNYLLGIKLNKGGVPTFN